MNVWRPSGSAWRAAAPPGLVLTVGELRAQARIDAGDEDGLIARQIAAAVAAVERWTQRLLAARSCVLTLPSLPPSGFVIELPGGVVQSVASVVARTAGGDVTVDPATYEVTGDSPAYLALLGDAVWPEATRAVITYVAGHAPGDGPPVTYGANVPPDLLHAVALISADMFEYRENSGAVLRPVPINAEWLMAPHRIAPVPYQ